MHEEGVVHRDLHSNNVLVHKNSIKLSGFGLSKRVEDIEDDSKLFGSIPYVDPVLFKGKGGKEETISQRLEKYKKSDVYSVGVLLWELSSGKIPFNEYNVDFLLAVNIVKGIRETMVEGTPIEYYNLYNSKYKIKFLKLSKF